VVGYHRTNTATEVFYSVLSGLSGHCLLRLSIPQSSDSHLMPRHLIPCETWTHAELVTPPALPPRVHFPTRAIRSARRSSYAARTSFVTPASVRASSITCTQVLGPTVLAAAISIDRCYGRLYHLPPADAMTNITQVVLLSVRQELRS